MLQAGPAGDPPNGGDQPLVHAVASVQAYNCLGGDFAVNS